MKDMEREMTGATMTPAERQELQKAMERDMARQVYSRGGATTTKNEMKRMARKGKR
jgi:hypothetical protein